MSNTQMSSDANWQIVEATLAELKRQGVTGEVALSQSETWKANVRLGDVEQVEGATKRSFRVAAIASGGRRGSASTSETTAAAAIACAAKAAELAAYGDADEWVGLPPSEECGLTGGDLGTDDPAYAQLDRDALLNQVIAAEKIAMGVDPRITNADGSGVSTRHSENWYGTTDGVRVQRSGTRFSYHVVVVAQSAAGERQLGGYGTSARHLSKLWDAQTVGAEAGRRAVRFYNWRKAPTGACRVIFDNESASDLLDIIVGGCQGSSIYRGSTYLAGSLGQTIASDLLTVTDDPLIPGALASRPCDGEGVRSRATTIIQSGKLESFLVDGYAARRLKHPYTGHEGGSSNIRVQPGKASFADLVKELNTGLIVHELHGFGVDIASGQYSRGVSGYWVENGTIAYPVQEVTIAGNLRELLPGILAIGNDPLPQSSTSSPSLLIEGFTVGGA